MLDFVEEFIDCALAVRRNDKGVVVFEEKDGYKPVVFTDKELMLTIRDEAVIRHLENRNKKENIETTTYGVVESSAPALTGGSNNSELSELDDNSGKTTGNNNDNSTGSSSK